MWMFADINKGLAECRSTEGALLIDVREPEEYASGHIPGAVNVPLSSFDGAGLPRDRALFLYCQRGIRSARAAARLKKRGYTKAKSIGGIAKYKGKRDGE